MTGVPDLSGIASALLAAAALVVLILPGIALAIFSRPAPSMRRLDLLLVAAVLSLGYVVIGGLILNLAPGGLSRTSWLGLTVVVPLLAIAAFARRGLPPLRRDGWVRPKKREAVALFAAGALVTLALLVARLGVNQPTKPFTALWIVPASSGMVEIGIDNHEEAVTTYRIDVNVNGTIEASFPDVTVAVGERWTKLISEPDADGSQVEVLAYLSIQRDVVYRRVTFSAATHVP